MDRGKGESICCFPTNDKTWRKKLLTCLCERPRPIFAWCFGTIDNMTSV